MAATSSLHMSKADAGRAPPSVLPVLLVVPAVTFLPFLPVVIFLPVLPFFFFVVFVVFFSVDVCAVSSCASASNRSSEGASSPAAVKVIPIRSGARRLWKKDSVFSASSPCGVVKSTTKTDVYRFLRSMVSCHDGWSRFSSPFGHSLYSGSFSMLFKKYTPPFDPLRTLIRMPKMPAARSVIAPKPPALPAALGFPAAFTTLLNTERPRPSEWSRAERESVSRATLSRVKMLKSSGAVGRLLPLRRSFVAPAPMICWLYSRSLFVDSSTFTRDKDLMWTGKSCDTRRSSSNGSTACSTRWAAWKPRFFMSHT